MPRRAGDVGLVLTSAISNLPLYSDYRRVKPRHQ